MAINFTLTPRNDPGNGPMSLVHIDNGICAHMGIAIHDKDYCLRWYDTIGLRAAFGQSLVFMAREYADYAACCLREGSQDGFERYAKLSAIALFLDTNYIVDSWYGR